MSLMIDEVMLIHTHRTWKRMRKPIPEDSCALCGGDEELISAAAAARIAKVNPLKLREWLAPSPGSAYDFLRPETLVCLDCLARCQLSQPNVHV